MTDQTTAHQNKQKSTKRNFDFLNLPLELREGIYIALFGQGIILHNNKRAATRQQRLVGTLRQLCPTPTFIPANKQKNLFAILLTCRQCYHEGLALYYRHSTVKGLLSISPVWLSAPLPYHALDEAFEIPGWRTFPGRPQRANPAIVPAGCTSNLSMVLEHSWHFVDDASRPVFSSLGYARSVRVIEYQTPDQFLAADQTIAHISLSSKQNIERWELSSSYLWRYLPRPCLRTRRSTKDLREEVFGRTGSTMCGYPEGTLESLEDVLAEKPRAKFMLICPVLYVSDDQRCCAICDFDLRTEELVSKRLVIEDSMYSVGYFRLEDFD